MRIAPRSPNRFKCVVRSFPHRLHSLDMIEHYADRKNETSADDLHPTYLTLGEEFRYIPRIGCCDKQVA